MIYLHKKCKFCFKEFEPKSPNQQFCCIKCQKDYTLQNRRKRYKNPLPKITNCLQCGKPLEGHYKKFCSEKCIIEHRKDSRRKTNRICNPVIEPKVLNKCKLCGKDIPFVHNYASTYNKKKFCSRECCKQYFKLNKQDFKGNQYKIGEFKIIIKKVLNKFIWEALKNEKIVLKSNTFFENYNICLKDAKLALK